MDNITSNAEDQSSCELVENDRVELIFAQQEEEEVAESKIVYCEGPPGAQGLIGPQGPQGPIGAQGPCGPPGPRGFPGLTGFGHIGPQGPQGLQGKMGPKGDRGERGLPGNQGPIGQEGNAGPRGPQGQEGIQGFSGEKGDIGPKGENGDIGPKGSKGAKGEKGDIGLEGVTGSQGPQGNPCDHKSSIIIVTEDYDVKESDRFIVINSYIPRVIKLYPLSIDITSNTTIPIEIKSMVCSGNHKIVSNTQNSINETHTSTQLISHQAIKLLPFGSTWYTF